MKSVEIFTEVCPKSPKAAHGRFKTVICYTKRNGEREMRVRSGFEENTTFNRMALIAALEGLEILKEPCKVTLHTECRFLKSCIEQNNVEKWRRQEWKNAKGKRCCT